MCPLLLPNLGSRQERLVPVCSQLWPGRFRPICGCKGLGTHIHFPCQEADGRVWALTATDEVKLPGPQLQGPMCDVVMSQNGSTHNNGQSAAVLILQNKSSDAVSLLYWTATTKPHFPATKAKCWFMAQQNRITIFVVLKLYYKYIQSTGKEKKCI